MNTPLQLSLIICNCYSGRMGKKKSGHGEFRPGTPGGGDTRVSVNMANGGEDGFTNPIVMVSIVHTLINYIFLTGFFKINLLITC